MARKDAFSLTLDATAANFLTRIAQREHEGNLSQTVRFVLREAAERRGLSEQQGVQQQVKQEHREAVTA